MTATEAPAAPTGAAAPPGAAPPAAAPAPPLGAAFEPEHLALFEPALSAAVHRLPAAVRRVAGYHLGWWDEDERPLFGPDATDEAATIRPALALLCGEAAGGRASSALPAAVAVELAHHFSLLHDDIMDGGGTRRRRPAAWTVFGAAQALLTGDSLMVAAMDVLAAASRDIAPRALHDLAAGLQDLGAGRSAELRLASAPAPTPDDCREVIAGKTASLLGCACSLGTMFGGGSPERVRLMRMFGERLGHAAHLAEDMRGVWGDPPGTGGAAHRDLARRKRSLPVVAALASGTAEGRELAAAFETGAEFSPAVLAHLAGLVERTGARRLAAGLAAENLAGAAACLDAAGPPPGPAAALRAVLDRVAARIP
ncbi:polyprenyl synthetase family protein [Actinomadura litoris]|uniref:Polyprenyl synthetase family protein n=1 Tax=Actinomadura litoris TaxID=2678616 RepID=A0A7K1KWW8_9ACTN|nr:polyprenyl synthetase family protein [Actinomadura litoris]MUN36557.1 polyprenyl synthetase family protein [Actinomadura litoris]